MNIHDDSKGFKCDVRLKAFNSKLSYERHYIMIIIIIILREKPFVCPICDRKFAENFALVRHRATHSEIKSYKCSICPEGRFFKTKGGLNNHMLYHYEPKIHVVFVIIKVTLKVI